MISRAFRKGESTLRFLARQVIDLCAEIDDTGLESGIDDLRRALQTMERYRRVLFFGGAGCGRSAMIAGVAGFPAIARVAWSGPYRSWRYIASMGEDLNARYIPVPELEGLELTDTPDCEPESVQESIVSLAESADVIVAVVDARRAEQSPCWQLLSRLPAEFGRCLVAVTGAGALSADEGLELKEKLRSGCGHPLKVPLTVCFVNPTVQHEMEMFCGRVQAELSGERGMRRDLKAVDEAMRRLQDRQGAILKRREEVQRSDNGFLDEVESEFESIRRRQENGVAAWVQKLFAGARALLPSLQKSFLRSFGLFYSPVNLVRLSLYGRGVEKCYARMLEEMMRKSQEDYDATFVQNCSSLWETVRPKMKAVLECEPGVFPEESLSVNLAGLRDRFSLEMRSFLASRGLGASLSRAVATCREWMHGVLVLDSILLSVAGMLGIFQQIEAACIVLCLAVTVWLLAWVRHLIDRRRLCRILGELVEGMHEALYAYLCEAVHTLVLSRVAAYRSLYNAPRRKVAANAELLHPLQKRHQTLCSIRRRNDLFV